jgi:hypothetical protein
MIRAMTPADALALSFSRRRSQWEGFTATTWPRTPPETERPGAGTFLRHALLPSPRIGHVGVATHEGGVTGFVMLRPRASGLVWDVAQLDANNKDDAVELARWAQERALASRGRRVMLDTADSGAGPVMARQARYEQYTQGTTFTIAPGFSRIAEDALPARPRLRADEVGLFQLYSAAVPASVRVAEAMTQEEWAALYPGRKLWAPAILGNSQDYVWEMGSKIAGWMRVTYGQRSQSLDLLIQPAYDAYAERMIRYALTQMSAKVPVVSDVREYQGGVCAALERVGFQPGPRYQAWYRALASRVPDPGLAALQAPVSPG